MLMFWQSHLFHPVSHIFQFSFTVFNPILRQFYNCQFNLSAISQVSLQFHFGFISVHWLELEIVIHSQWERQSCFCFYLKRDFLLHVPEFTIFQLWGGSEGWGFEGLDCWTSELTWQRTALLPSFVDPFFWPQGCKIVHHRHWRETTRRRCR